MGAADLTKGITTMTDRDAPDFEPHASSPTDRALTELQLYGHRPFQDEPDPRPLPEGKLIGGAVADMFDALIATLQDTRLEPDLPDLLWSTVNLFHRATDRVQRELDANEVAQKRSQKEQDGSEIRSVELERLIAEGLTLIERRNSMELFRDLAALLLPATLRRLYVALDRDAAGDAVMVALTDRAQASGIESIGLLPRLGDFNEDVQQFGIDDLRAALRMQLVPEDVTRFMSSVKEDDMSG